jgi:hypothetical protein
MGKAVLPQRMCGCAVRESEISKLPFLVVLEGCSARRDERGVASHTSEEQRRNAPASAAKIGMFAISDSLSVQVGVLVFVAQRRFQRLERQF